MGVASEEIDDPRVLGDLAAPHSSFAALGILKPGGQLPPRFRVLERLAEPLPEAVGIGEIERCPVGRI